MFLYIDIETLPIQCPDKADEYVANAKAPGNMKKPETIEKWRVDSRDEILAKTSFDGGQGQIACIGWAFDDGEIWCPYYRPETKDSGEYTAIDEFFHCAGDYIGSHMPVIVGHNVSAFDLLFLRKRCMVHGIKLPAWFPRDLKPWSTEIFDTMVQWDSRNSVSLDNLAKIFGIEGKGDVDGSMVAQMWADGKHQEIADYCKADVKLTRKIHQQMMKAL